MPDIYSQWPSVNSLVPNGNPQPQTASVQPKNFTGSGSFAAGNGFHVGGPTGLSVQSGIGMWSGNQNFGSAPFSVDEQGNLTAAKATITGTVQSGSGKQKVVMNGKTDEIDFYDTNGNLVGALYANPVTMLLASSNTGTPAFALSGTTSFGGGANSEIQIGAQTAVLQIVSSGFAEFIGCNVTIDQNLSVTGTKAFDIPHPDGTKEKRLRYIAVESPEVLVTCRGQGDFSMSAMPDHFTTVSEPDTLQVIQGTDPLTGNPSWIATAVRKGYANFRPEYFLTPPQDAQTS